MSNCWIAHGKEKGLKEKGKAGEGGCAVVMRRYLFAAGEAELPSENVTFVASQRIQCVVPLLLAARSCLGNNKRYAAAAELIMP